MTNYERKNVVPATAEVSLRGSESAGRVLSRNALVITSPYNCDNERLINRKCDNALTLDGNEVKQLSKEVNVMVDNSPSPEIDIEDRELLVKQALKYADDLATLFEEEKVRAKALQHANERLKREIAIRRQAEKELLLAKQELEKRVDERTKDLSSANERLQQEVNQRKQVEDRLMESLKEKETLIIEVHHRVKNNLQIISSLLGLQSNGINDDKVLQALRDSRSRITSMALIHEQLYCSKDLAAIDFTRYINNLTTALLATHCQQPDSIDLKIHVDNVLLPVGTALPCGLIINELLTNCLKHAFPDRRLGEVLVEFRNLPKHGYSLTVKDNGAGLPASVDYRNSKSLGLQLVKNLAEIQLEGTLTVEGHRGTCVKIEFQTQQES